MLLFLVASGIVLSGVLQSKIKLGSDPDVDNGTVKSPNLPVVVIRIDDVQDYAFRDAQLMLFRYHTENKIPTSIAVIPELAKSDTELLTQISDSLRIGSEVSSHGWSHEDLSKLSQLEQEKVLREARLALELLFKVNVTVLVPPMFGYNVETLKAMHNTGFEIISSSIDLQSPMRRADGIVLLPATVEYSDFVDGKWVSKSVEGRMMEVNLSVEKNGYAVIVIHPQELMRDNQIDAGAVQDYCSLVELIQAKYSFTTLSELSKSIR
ncbi:MAG: DUF2334 domain-containing protein [Candidatus Bathyarchaeota archaeon]|nr:DUF2334 domain-containing protein [Candidatus Bathyarchaeota archaeon]